MRKQTKIIGGLAAIVITGGIGFLTSNCSRKNYTPPPATTQKENTKTTPPTSQRVIRTMETVYFHFKVPDAVERVYLVDANGEVLSKIIEDGKNLVDIKTKRSFSGGSYKGMYYDFTLLEKLGSVEIPYTLEQGAQLSIKLRGIESYTEPVELDANSERRINEIIQKSMEKGFEKKE